MLIGFAIPLCILGYMYFKIFHSVKHHTRRMSRVSLSSSSGVTPTRVHKQVAVTVFIMLIFFVICWLPFYLYVLIVMTTAKAMRQSFPVQFLGRAGYWCAFLNSAINPYIYGFRNPQFRTEFQYLLCWLCPRACAPATARSKSCSSITGSRGSWDAYDFHRQGGMPSLLPGRPIENNCFEFGLEGFYSQNNIPELLRFECPPLDENHGFSQDHSQEENSDIEDTFL